MLSFKFEDIKKENQEVVSTKKYIKDLKNSFKYMMQSDRLKYLFIFGAVFAALLGVLVSLRSGTLEQIGVPEQYFGVIFALLGIVSGIIAYIPYIGALISGFVIDSFLVLFVIYNSKPVPFI